MSGASHAKQCIKEHNDKTRQASSVSANSSTSSLAFRVLCFANAWVWLFRDQSNIFTNRGFKSSIDSLNESCVNAAAASAIIRSTELSLHHSPHCNCSTSTTNGAPRSNSLRIIFIGSSSCLPSMRKNLLAAVEPADITRTMVLIAASAFVETNSGADTENIRTCMTASRCKHTTVASMSASPASWFAADVTALCTAGRSNRCGTVAIACEPRLCRS
mmetsp:Transcript_92980/g.146976  ORF Transcript_92980/g.146976 Transcript_92980/m.146976 type:complete len:217 (-) Transcript_92980:1728-2378(-)